MTEILTEKVRVSDGKVHLRRKLCRRKKNPAEFDRKRRKLRRKKFVGPPSDRLHLSDQKGRDPTGFLTEIPIGKSVGNPCRFEKNFKKLISEQNYRRKIRRKFLPFWQKILKKLD